MSAILLLSGFVRTEAILAADIRAAQVASGSTDQEALSSYGRLLARLADPGRYPALHAVIAAGVFDAPDAPDDEFIFGLDRVLDGLDALVRARRSMVPSP